MTENNEKLRRTPLYETHKSLGAKMVGFAGWEMPVKYTSELEEHKAVRERVGLFDVSHMGEVEVAGPNAIGLVQKITSNDVSKLADFHAQYSILLNEKGGAIDDLIVYRKSSERILICVNASNADVDYAWIKKFEAPGAAVTNLSDNYALISIQGPLAEKVILRLTSMDISRIEYYSFGIGDVAGHGGMLARTGYTGEDGFEFFCNTKAAVEVWQKMMSAGKEFGIAPAGLGARDTLRLEMGYALYGHELNMETTPYEAGLSWVLKMDKGEFTGRDALAKAKAAGPRKIMVGFVMEESGIPRSGYEIMSGGKAVGAVTSGSWSPTLEKGIGLGYIQPGMAKPGDPLDIKIRNRIARARVQKPPFVQSRVKKKA